MANTGVPDEVKKFITEKISSLGQLEVLLLLYKDRTKAWTAKQVGEELRGSNEGATRQLQTLTTRQLITENKKPGSLSTFQYPSNSINDKLIKDLELYYATHRVSIISLIYEQPDDALRTFSEAFKFKRNS